jgi:Na+/H+-dicarboxylate symporter
MWLTSKIIAAMFFGILFGSVIKFLNDIGWFGPVGYLIFYDIFANGVFDIIGKIFIASLRLAVVPLVFVSLICGVCSIASTSQLRSISFKTISLYLFTTAVAISLALFCALLIEPGTNLNMALPQEFSPQTAPSFKDVIVNIFPTNPIAAMAEGNMLQIIVFALLFGIALKGAGDFAEPLRHSFERLNKVILKLVTTLITLAPYGVFSLLLTIFAMQGIGVIGN